MTQIALNARFHVHRPTGMQRYGIEMSQRIDQYLYPLRPTAALRGASGHLWEQLYLPAAVRGRMLWSPNNTGPLAVTRQVCTIHDLIPIDHPEWFSKPFSEWYCWLLPRLVRRVQHIIAVSEFTKGRVIDAFGIREEKVSVVHNGIESRYQPASMAEIEAMRAALQIEGPYLLYVGSLEPRKNLLRLLKAWRMAQSSVPAEVRLVVAGARGASRVFGTVEMDASVPRVHFSGYVPEEHLPGLYSGALAAVYPSLYEGFGLPPLEAMACGTPVLTSDNTSLPEVVGSCAMLVDPENEDSIAEGIVELLRNPSGRERFRRLGIERSKRFTWEESARRTLRVLLEQARN